MIRQWLAGHRQAAAAALSGTAIVGVVSTIAIVSGGYTAQRIDLGDGTVWVASQDHQMVGRANAQVYELNSVVDTTSGDVQILQQGSSVLIADLGNSAIEQLDPATSRLGQGVPLPPSPQVDLAGGTVVISADGSIWTSPVASIGDFQSAAQPQLTLGSGTIVSAAADGAVFAFTPSTGTVSQIDADAGTVVATSQVAGAASDDDYQLTSVAGQWALLDDTQDVLYTASGRSDLGDSIPAGTQVRVQRPSDRGDDVLVAHTGGLLSIPLAGGDPTVLPGGRNGSPAAPVVVGDCSYAAWSDATVWRRCGTAADGTTAQLSGLSGQVQLQFQINGAAVVLNDIVSGAAWAVQADNQLIDNWSTLIDQRHAENVTQDNDDDNPPQYEKQQQPPTATDDEFGARPGRSTELPVLLNDFDPNGDVLVISSVTDIPAELGRLDVISNGQQLLLTLPESASGSLTFEYTIDDGRGGQDVARVSVTVRTPDENEPPRQARTTRATVQEGGRVTVQVLGDWYDPDGDAFFLSSASAPEPDKASYKPDGTVVFSDAPGGDDDVRVGLVVSDGRDQAAGTLVVGVRPIGTVPILTDAFVVPATVGVEATVNPLAHVRGGNGQIKLANVPAKPDVDITPDYDGGTFRFVASQAKTYYLEYAVTDGVTTATGLVRVDVSPAVEASQPPITVPHTAFVRSQSSANIDVLASDIDPGGGVLLITSVDDLPVSTGLRIETLDQRLLRVTLMRPLENGQASFGYTVSNGVAEARGMVTVIEVPPPAVRQAPIANPDTASVRVGNVIDIPVLANDEQPDGDELTLDPALPARPEGSGLLFASGNVLRYLAPDRPGNYTAVYRVNAPDGQFATAEVHIAVREADPTSNSAPVPQTVTSRVFSGDTVRIEIPLSGIDPDGDSVQLIGQRTNPQKGAVTSVGSDWFDYTAGEYSTGTDTFTYRVIDALGARATGTVRIGISPRPEGGRNPVAVQDDVQARPGSAILVRVLTNDSDPDGGALTITDVERATGKATAEIQGDLVRVEVPDAEGQYSFLYTVTNPRGGTSTAFLVVHARADAPLSRPDAHDTVLTLSDILGRETVDVDVLANVFFADGPARDLDLKVYTGYGSVARVTASDRIRVRIGDKSQIIPFVVTNPADPALSSYAFIWVPGYDDALPQLKRSARPLTVVSEAVLKIDINDYVVAVGGKKVHITDTSTVQATHSDGGDLVVDDTTLRFRSADRYFGPASISFDVTDGASADDPDGRTATIVLPITVTPRENQPPVFTGGVIDFEPGQSKTINLVRLTSYPYPDDLDELAYSILDPAPAGADYRLDGQKLVITASASARKGTQTAITLGVRDSLKEGTAGRIVIRFVASTRPLAVPAADTAIAPRGKTTTVDVLANDNATNPFPDVPLRVISQRVAGGGQLPAGVSMTPSSDGSRLLVTVSADAAPVDTNLEYEVADATGDPDRYAWGSVRISVQDRPDPVAGLHVTGYGDRQLTVAFDAAAFNNSPITGYTVSLVSPGGGVVSSAPCVATVCTVATAGNGQSNAVLVRVVATNGIGDSDPAATATPAWSDIVPPAPTGLTAAPLDGGLRLGWDVVTAPDGASPVSNYVVTVGAVQLGAFMAADICTASRCSLDTGGLVNGSSVPFSISARNGAYPALTTWNSSSGTGTPYGPPIAGGIRVIADSASGSVVVQWDAFNGNGNDIAGYFVQRLASTPAGAPLPPVPAGACSVSSPAPGTVTAPSGDVTSVPAGTTQASFSGLTDQDTSYNFVVWGYNRSGCRPTAVGGSVVRPAPGPVTAVDASVVPDAYSQDLQVRSVTAAGAARYDIRLVDAGGNPVSSVQSFSGAGTPRTMFGTAWGDTIRFQVRGCSSWGSCGAWSGVQPSAPQPSLTWELPSRQYLQDDATGTGTWSWTNAPQNGSYAASFRCGIEGDAGTAAQTPNSCTIPGVTAGVHVWLEIEINSLTRRYTQ